MEQLRFSVTKALAFSMLLFMFSCNAGEEKKSDVTAADTVKAVPAEATPKAAVKPSNIMLIMHKVANFAKWKPIFEANDSMQKAYGLHNYVLARGVKDSNMVMIALRMDVATKAKELGAEYAQERIDVECKK